MTMHLHSACTSCIRIYRCVTTCVPNMGRSHVNALSWQGTVHVTRCDTTRATAASGCQCCAIFGSTRAAWRGRQQWAKCTPRLAPVTVIPEYLGKRNTTRRRKLHTCQCVPACTRAVHMAIPVSDAPQVLPQTAVLAAAALAVPCATPCSRSSMLHLVVVIIKTLHKKHSQANFHSHWQSSCKKTCICNDTQSADVRVVLLSLFWCEQLTRNRLYHRNCFQH